MSNHIRLLFLPAIIFFNTNVFSQNFTERYDLNFLKTLPFGAGQWQKKISNCVFLYDSTEIISNKHPLSIAFRPPPFPVVASSQKMEFCLGRTIVLPNNSPASLCEVSLTAKTETAEILELRVRSIDRNYAVFNEVSLLINNTHWKDNVVQLPLTNAEAIEITLTYTGNASVTQKVWLDKLKIKINGLDISDVTYRDMAKRENISYPVLDKKYVQPLSVSNECLIDKIGELNNKKIIGLGEFAYGSLSSKDIFQLFVTNLLKKKCKVIALNIPPDKGLLIDLYINEQEKPPSIYLKKTINEIIENKSDDYANFTEFLAKMRKYNQTHTEKIHIVGIGFDTNWNLYLPDYFIAILGAKKSKRYVDSFFDENMLFSPNYSTIINTLTHDKEIRHTLSQSDFQLLTALLNVSKKYCSTKYTFKKETLQDVENKNDSLMAEQVKKVVDIYLKKDDKILIFAHSNCLAKNIKTTSYGNKKNMGYYLDKEYKSNFFNISIQPISGTYTIEKDYPFFSVLTNDTLTKPTFYSLEYAVSAFNQNIFYYPSNCLPHQIKELRCINNGGRFSDQFILTDTKKYFDGYIITKNSSALVNYNKNIYFYPDLSDEKNNYNRIMRLLQLEDTKKKNNKTINEILRGKNPATI